MSSVGSETAIGEMYSTKFRTRRGRGGLVDFNLLWTGNTRGFILRITLDFGTSGKVMLLETRGLDWRIEGGGGTSGPNGVSYRVGEEGRVQGCKGVWLERRDVEIMLVMSASS